MTSESEHDDSSPDEGNTQPGSDSEPQTAGLSPQSRWLTVGMGLLAVVLILVLVGPGLRDRLWPLVDPAAASIPKLEQAAAADPKNEALQYQLASAYYRARRFDKAWPQFRTVEAYRSAAEAQPEIAEAEGAVQAAPSSKEAHFRLGTVWTRSGLLVPAETAFQQAVALDSRYADAHANLGAVYYQMNRLADALREYDAALAVNPNDADVHHNKGVVYVQQAIQISPTNQTLLNQGVGEFQRALEINPNLPQVHFSLGVVYMMHGQSQEAIAELQRFLALDDGSDPKATADAHTYLTQLGQQ
jgi:tetratricopeptide (TPR) repeat protein